MGLDSLKIADIAFNNVRVHKSNILGTVGEGFKVIIKTMELMRIANAAVSLGIAERAYYEALDYSKMRKISNSPMCNMQIMQYKLANMKSALQIMNISTFYPAYLFDLNPSYVEFDSSVAKYFVTEKAKEVCDIALQMFGGYGYIKGYTVERLYRDVRIMTILGGTSELIQAIISFGILQGKYK
jgi:butyryl-CoA dehydrogenase